MSLKAFHFVFILASIGLSIWFGVWCVNESSFTGSSLTLGMGLFSFAAAAGLAIYLVWFLRKYRNLGFILIPLLFASVSTVAEACPVCIGDPNSLFVKSANSAVGLLLGIVALVLVGFAALFIHWGRRDRQYQAKSAD